MSLTSDLTVTIPRAVFEDFREALRLRNQVRTESTHGRLLSAAYALVSEVLRSEHESERAALSTPEEPPMNRDADQDCFTREGEARKYLERINAVFSDVEAGMISGGGKMESAHKALDCLVKMAAYPEPAEPPLTHPQTVHPQKVDWYGEPYVPTDDCPSPDHLQRTAAGLLEAYGGPDPSCEPRSAEMYASGFKSAGGAFYDLFEEPPSPPSVPASLESVSMVKEFGGGPQINLGDEGEAFLAAHLGKIVRVRLEVEAATVKEETTK